MARRYGKKRRGRLKPSSPEVAGAGGKIPFVALLGRPNVGKSTLFNRLVGRRLAITEPTAGTTRDRIAAIVHLDDGRTFELCDMGGVGGTGDAFDREVNHQIDLALEYADLVLFVVDARDGLTAKDEAIARRVKKLGLPVIVVVNKTESQKLEVAGAEFYALGFQGDLLFTSAQEGIGRADLLDRIGETLAELDEAGDEGSPEEGDEESAEDEPTDEDSSGEPTDEEPTDEEPTDEELAGADAAGDGARAPAAAEKLVRIAIVGRRNVGKSTYVNRLFGSERVLVSDVAGTTRDAVDVPVTVDGRDVVLIDTAGLRKRGRVDDSIEIISHGRAVEAIRRCDVVLLVLDALQEISQVDKMIARHVEQEHKACVIVANKWDAVAERMTAEQFGEYVGYQLPGLLFAPVVTISAREGTHATAPIRLAFTLMSQARVQVSTGQLNRVLAAAITRRRPKPKKANRQGRVYFATQIATNPVTLLMFVNDPFLFDKTWLRYLQGQLRRHTPWKEVPIKLVMRSREAARKKGGSLGRRLDELGGLGERARWIEDDPSRNIESIAGELDATAVQEALLEEVAEDEPEWDDADVEDEPDDDEP